MDYYYPLLAMRVTCTIRLSCLCVLHTFLSWCRLHWPFFSPPTNRGALSCIDLTFQNMKHTTNPTFCLLIVHKRAKKVDDQQRLKEDQREGLLHSLSQVFVRMMSPLITCTKIVCLFLRFTSWGWQGSAQSKLTSSVLLGAKQIFIALRAKKVLQTLKHIAPL